MRNTKLFTIVLLFVITITASNCSADHNILPTTEESLTRNGWGVDYYFQQQDMTSEFEEYRITFRSNGTVNCRKETEMISGTWNKAVNAGQSEIISINISTSNPSINKLNGSWKLVNQSSNSMNFENFHPSLTSVLRIRVKP